MLFGASTQGIHTDQVLGDINLTIGYKQVHYPAPTRQRPLLWWERCLLFLIRIF